MSYALGFHRDNNHITMIQLTDKQEVWTLKEIDIVVWKELEYYVVQCLNVDVSSFGDTKDEAMQNLKEAVELYFEGESGLAGLTSATCR